MSGTCHSLDTLGWLHKTASAMRVVPVCSVAARHRSTVPDAKSLVSEPGIFPELTKPFPPGHTESAILLGTCSQRALSNTFYKHAFKDKVSNYYTCADVALLNSRRLRVSLDVHHHMNALFGLPVTWIAWVGDQFRKNTFVGPHSYKTG